MQIFKLTYNKYFYYFVLTILGTLSFFYYAPCCYNDYLSDHAIHVLMSKQFELPRDFYYWGQNRLGSFFPMICFGIIKLLPIHPLIVCSIVLYLFLIVGFILLVKNIKNYFLCIALFVIIFLPLNDYYYIILIGHPYVSQFFAGSLFVLFLSKLKNYVLINKIQLKNLPVIFSLTFFSIFFLACGIWVSEFNAILVLIPICYFFIQKDIRQLIKREYRNKYFILFFSIIFLLILLAVKFYKYTKSTVINDATYDKYIINNISDLLLNFYYFLEKLKISLLFQDKFVISNLFNWFVILISSGIIYVVFKNRGKIKIKNHPFIFSLFIVICFSIILLFLSTWNLRSKFDPKYFTPVYIMYCYLLFLILDKKIFHKKIKITISLIFIFFSITVYSANVITKKLSGPLTSFKDYMKLSKGTLIGDYWDVYAIGSVAIDSLEAISYDHLTVRNWDWREKILSARNFFVINNNHVLDDYLHNVLFQFGYHFKFTGKKYYCNNEEVWLYYKLNKPLLKKFTIKSSNNLYISLEKNSNRLVANQEDSTKAEIFELIILRNGTALKATNGKFVSADFGLNSQLFANSDHAWDWELFRLIPITEEKYNIKASNNEFLSADREKSNYIIANRKRALEWESFQIIQIP